MKDTQHVKIILSQVFFHRGLLDRQGEGRCCWQFCILAQFGTWGHLDLSINKHLIYLTTAQNAMKIHHRLLHTSAERPCVRNYTGGPVPER